MARVKITVRRNGPYRVETPEGEVELVDADGHRYDLTGKTAFSLCRCGGSTTKPFCDGTHSKIGFQGAESAVKAAGGGAPGGGAAGPGPAGSGAPQGPGGLGTR
jgi:3-phenylpropionate/trans-cinnamate dioxygenase ferredoxin subunit